MEPGPWEPLARPIFRSLWIASIASNVGTWIHEVGAGWLMTSLSPSPLMVALVQAATSLPMFLFAVPSGALSDVLDRRRLLIAAQAWMALVALVLGLSTILGRTSAWSLLALTFAMGLGTVLSAPAFQAIVPELVPRGELPSAVYLNSLGFNLARSAGPALGGLVIAGFGPGGTFVLNAVSFLGVVIVLARWRRPPPERLLPGERFLSALRLGLRYVRHAPPFHAVLARGALFVTFASALWALLPVVVRFELVAGPGGYGLALGCFGAGAVAGAISLPRLVPRISRDRLATVATVLFATALLLMGSVDRYPVVCLALFAAGGAWLTVLSGFNVAAQLSLPPWVRARALSIYLLVFYGSMATGSYAWGALASIAGTAVALTLAALGLVLGLAARWRFRLPEVPAQHLAPSRHWPAPLVPSEPHPDRGPVLVTVEYRIDPARAREFAGLMRLLRRSRRRGGAVRWGLWADASRPGRYLESFVDESWLEHLRHHERVTAEDREIETRVRAFHLSEEPPVVTHYLAEPPEHWKD